MEYFNEFSWRNVSDSGIASAVFMLMLLSAPPRVQKPSNAVHNFALLKHSLEDQLTQDNKALTKAKADNSEFALILGSRAS